MLQLNLIFPSKTLSLIVISHFNWLIFPPLIWLHWNSNNLLFWLPEFRHYNRKRQMHVFFCVLFISSFAIPHAEWISYPILHNDHVINTSLIPLVLIYIYLTYRTWLFSFLNTSCIVQILSFLFGDSNVWTQLRNHALIPLPDWFGF